MRKVFCAAVLLFSFSASFAQSHKSSKKAGPDVDVFCTAINSIVNFVRSFKDSRLNPAFQGAEMKQDPRVMQEPGTKIWSSNLDFCYEKNGRFHTCKCFGKTACVFTCSIGSFSDKKTDQCTKRISEVNSMLKKCLPLNEWSISETGKVTGTADYKINYDSDFDHAHVTIDLEKRNRKIVVYLNIEVLCREPGF